MRADEYRGAIFTPTVEIEVSGASPTPPTTFDPSTATLEDALEMIALLTQVLLDNNLVKTPEP